MTELRLEDAVPLGYALVSRVARDSGVRALGIKGPVAVEQRLRPADHVPVDVDVWVDPAGVDEFSARLKDLGWRLLVDPTSAEILERHSLAYVNEFWPCEIDVHDRYPGLLEPADVAFEQAWKHHEGVTIAGVSVAAPDRPMSVVIHALHRLRDQGPESPDAATFADLARRELTVDELAGLRSVVVATGAAGPLQPFLTQLGVDVPVADRYHDAMVRWRIATAMPDSKSVPAVFELLNAPMRRWPSLAWNSLWLTEGEIRATQPDTPPGALGLLRARLRRTIWGLRGLPSAIRLVRRERSGD